MKINNFIVAIAIIGITALGAAGFYISQNFNQGDSEGLPSVPLTATNREADSDGDIPEVPKEAPKGTLLTKEDFEITLQPGWREAQNPPEGVLTMAIDSEEDLSSAASSSDYRTNLTVKSDDLTKYSTVNTLETYTESIKTTLVQLIEDIKFTYEKRDTVNGNDALFVECESTQNKVDFKTLLVFVQGDNNFIYALSFNAFQNSWASYRDAFYRMAESFKLRYNLSL